MTDESALRERLAELAEDAGEMPGAASEPADLWARGVRRQRRRRAAYAGGGLAAAVALVAGVALGGQLVGESAEPGPAVPPASELHLPDRILRPDPWSEGTAEAGEIGPLAAIGEAERLRPRGWNHDLGDYQLFGVSAVDGTSRFLDLPVDEKSGESRPWFGSGTALSPDGRWVGYEVRREDVQSEDEGGPVTGWRLYDSVTGETVDLTDPERPRLWTTGNDLIFTADSRYLLTSYHFDGPPTANATHGLVAWDVETRERIVVEEPGHYWHPGIGSSPRGFLLDRKFSVRHIDPASGEVERFRLPKAVVSSSIGPDGDAFAYIGGDWTPGRDGGIDADTWRLYAGPDRHHLEQVALPDGDLTGVLLGWSDQRHVVISGWGQDHAEVDVVTGEVRPFRIAGGGGGPATKANDLWANPLVPAVAPPGASDPRTPWQVLTFAGVGIGLVGLVLVRRRGRSVVGYVVVTSLTIATVAAGVGGVLSARDHYPAPTSKASALPDQLYMPSRWLPDTAGHPIGPLAVLGTADRGASGEPDFVGVSATTGEYRFLDLPGYAGPSTSGPMLSPSGRYIAYWLGGETDQAPALVEDGDPIVGVAVYDTVTGDVDRELVPTPHGLMPDRLLWVDDARLYFQAGQIVGTSRMDRSTSRSQGQGWLWEPGSRGHREIQVAGVDEFASPAAADGSGRLLFPLGRSTSRYVLVDPDRPEGRLEIPAVEFASGDIAVAADGRLAGLTPSPDSRVPATVTVVEPDGSTREVPTALAAGVRGWVGDQPVVEEVQPEVTSDFLAVRLARIDPTTGEATPLVEFAQADPGERLHVLGFATDLLPVPPVHRAEPDWPMDPRLKLGALGALVLLVAGGLAGVVLWRRRAR